MDKPTIGSLIDDFQKIFNNHYAAEISLMKSINGEKDKITAKSETVALNSALVMHDECLFLPENYMSFGAQFATNRKYRTFIRRLHRAFMTYGVSHFGTTFSQNVYTIIAHGCETTYVRNDYTPTAMNHNTSAVLTLTTADILGMIEAIPESATAHLASNAVLFFLQSDIKPEEFIRAHLGFATPSETPITK